MSGMPPREVAEQLYNTYRRADMNPDLAVQWWAEEDGGGNHHIGYCDFSLRPSTVYAIEAARALCAGALGIETARKLLKLAIEELDGK